MGVNLILSGRVKYRGGSVRRRSELGIKRKSDQNLPWFQIKMLGLGLRYQG